MQHTSVDLAPPDIIFQTQYSPETRALLTAELAALSKVSMRYSNDTAIGATSPVVVEKSSLKAPNSSLLCASAAILLSVVLLMYI